MRFFEFLRPFVRPLFSDGCTITLFVVMICDDLRPLRPLCATIREYKMFWSGRRYRKERVIPRFFFYFYYLSVVEWAQWAQIGITSCEYMTYDAPI